MIIIIHSSLTCQHNDEAQYVEPLQLLTAIDGPICSGVLIILCSLVMGGSRSSFKRKMAWPHLLIANAKWERGKETCKDKRVSVELIMCKCNLF